MHLNLNATFPIDLDGTVAVMLKIPANSQAGLNRFYLMMLGK